MAKGLCADCGSIISRSVSGGCCNRCSAKRAHMRMSDAYIVSKLRCDAPPELIALKREQLRLHRLANEFKQAITEQQEQTA